LEPVSGKCLEQPLPQYFLLTSFVNHCFVDRTWKYPLFAEPKIVTYLLGG
jgi:hypothetical protein